MNARERLEHRLRIALPEDSAEAAIADLDAYHAQVRRAVLGDDLNPSVLVLDAQAYRRLADDIAATMTDPDRWDGDEPEDMILGRYVKWLADGQPPRDDEWDGDQPTPDFFQPDRTYTNRHYIDDAGDYRFQCVTVTTHPVDGERLAIGWETDPTGCTHLTHRGIGHWRNEYDDGTQATGGEPA